MTQTTSELVKYLSELHLPTIKGCFQEEAENARRASLSHEKYLHQVMEREVEERLIFPRFVGHGERIVY